MILNLAIPDRSVPSDRTAFLRSVEELAAWVRDGRYLGVHCRAPRQHRTYSVLLASISMRLEWDAKTAFDAIESARGCSAPDTPEQRQWVIPNIPAVQ